MRRLLQTAAGVLSALLCMPLAATEAITVTSHGRITIRRGPAWLAAPNNAPLLPGDSLATAAGAHADLQFDSGHAFRVEGGSDLRVIAARDAGVELELASGAVTGRMAAQAAKLEIRTALVTARPTGETEFRITAKRTSCEITSVAGYVEVIAPQGSQWVNGGRKMIVRGPATDPEFRLVSGISFWKRFADAAARMIQSASFGGSSDDSESSSSSSSSSTESAPAASVPVARSTGSGNTGSGSSGAARHK